MQCVDSCTRPEHVAARFQAAIERIRADINGRSLMCRKIAIRARQFHLDVTPEHVDRHYDWFLRWYHGGIATGYLVNRTGVKRVPRIRITRGV